MKMILKKLNFTIINRHITFCFVFNVGDVNVIVKYEKRY